MPSRPGDRRISAIVRVRNEERFLRVAVESILDVVDEIVLVDNLSTDRTPEIVEALWREQRDRIVTHRYPHDVGRVGVESVQLARSSGGRSPRLSAVFYNWCLERCSHPYALKWDGDMVALDSLRAEIAAWRESEAEILLMRGANLHPGRRHLAAARVSDPERLGRGLGHELPDWATRLTYDSLEPRLFPRDRAEYRSDYGWTQRLWSPLLETSPTSPAVRCVERPCFLHLKLCKPDPFSNYSSDLAEAIAGNVAPGPSLDDELRAAVERWGLASS